jgi:hypothetical protein
MKIHDKSKSCIFDHSDSNITCIVIKVPDDDRDICIPGLPYALAVVERLEDGDEPGVLLHVARKVVYVFGTRVAGQGIPALVSLAGGRHGKSDVVGIACRKKMYIHTSRGMCPGLKSRADKLCTHHHNVSSHIYVPVKAL